MMIRRGSAGYYLNGVVARWPRAAVSLRDADTYARAGGVGVQDLAAADLALKNIYIADSPVTFQTASGTTVQNPVDLAGNALVASAATTAGSLFTAFPATIGATTTGADFDWTPAANAAIASGGLPTFTGKLATVAGTAVSGTAHRGAAAPGGAKWWAGWTRYARN